MLAMTVAIFLICESELSKVATRFIPMFSYPAYNVYCHREYNRLIPTINSFPHCENGFLLQNAEVADIDKIRDDHRADSVFHS